MHDPFSAHLFTAIASAENRLDSGYSEDETREWLQEEITLLINGEVIYLD